MTIIDLQCTWKAFKVGKAPSWPLVNALDLDFFLPTSETSASNWRFLIRSPLKLTLFIGSILQQRYLWEMWLVNIWQLEEMKRNFWHVLSWQLIVMACTLYAHWLLLHTHTHTNRRVGVQADLKQNCDSFDVSLFLGETDIYPQGKYYLLIVPFLCFVTVFVSFYSRWLGLYA